MALPSRPVPRPPFLSQTQHPLRSALLFSGPRVLPVALLRTFSNLPASFLNRGPRNSRGGLIRAGRGVWGSPPTSPLVPPSVTAALLQTVPAPSPGTARGRAALCWSGPGAAALGAEQGPLIVRPPAEPRGEPPARRGAARPLPSPGALPACRRRGTSRPLACDPGTRASACLAMDPSSAVPYARLEVPAAGSVPSYKYWSIFNILCCCLPLGLVALYYSGEVEKCQASRDTAEAKRASDTAKNINILALVIGLSCVCLFIFYMVRFAELNKAAGPTQPTLYYNIG
ncbi:uncharacterized protein LOC142001482 [Carettochelys insculpta]|uniref:uncharacterized protein LOC142001482 n=1 Tax=Carettochelys insculpta TaxID=44489 RepID=UPI003EBA202A